MHFGEGYNIKFWCRGRRGRLKDISNKVREDKSPIRKKKIPSLQIRVKFNCKFGQDYYQI